MTSTSCSNGSPYVHFRNCSRAKARRLHFHAIRKRAVRVVDNTRIVNGAYSVDCERRDLVLYSAPIASLLAAPFRSYTSIRVTIRRDIHQHALCTSPESWRVPNPISVLATLMTVSSSSLAVQMIFCLDSPAVPRDTVSL